MSLHSDFIGLCKKNQADEWAKKRGFNLEILSSLGIGECNLDVYSQLQEQHGRASLEAEGFFDKKGRGKYIGRIIIPFNETYFSARKEGSGLKNLFPKGKVREAWFISGDRERLWVVEGETDAIRLRHIFPDCSVFAFGGTDSAYLRDKLLTTIKYNQFKEVILCFDNDEAGQKYIQKTLKLLEKDFYTKGKTKICEFDKTKKDIDDYFKNGGSVEGLKFVSQNTKQIEQPTENNQWGIYNTEGQKVDDSFIWKTNSEGVKKLNHSGISDYLSNTYYIKTIGDAQKEIYYYDGGVYRSGGRNKLLKEIQKLTNRNVKNNDVQEIIKGVERNTILLSQIEEAPKHLINFKNGVYNIETGELTPHSPEFVFLHQIPHNWNSSAKCPKIQDFLKNTLQEKDIPLVHEFNGFCLYRKTFIKKAVILVGEKDTGKTTFIKMNVAALGLSNTCSVALHKICKDKFAASRLYGKLLNIYDDLPTQDIQDVGAFKVATGGGFVAGEKKFSDSFEFISYCKLLFACNKISRVNDSDDEAFYSRWVIIQFLNNFGKDSGKMDYNLDEKLTTPSEMEGLLVLAVEGLKTLLKNGCFSTDETTEETKLFMEKNSNNISSFAYDYVERKENSYVTFENLYEVYKLYCEWNGDAPESKDKFSKQFPIKVHYAKDYTPELEIDGKKQRPKSYLNIALRSTCSTFCENTLKYNHTKITTPLNISHDYKKGTTEPTQTELKLDSTLKSEDALLVLSTLAGSSWVDIDEYLSKFEPQHHQEVKNFISGWLRQGDVYEVRPGRIAINP